MKTIVITEDFEGYPSGRRRAFAKGDEVEVPDDFAELVIGKKHAREKPAETSGAKAKKENNA